MGRSSGRRCCGGRPVILTVRSRIVGCGRTVILTSFHNLVGVRAELLAALAADVDRLLDDVCRGVLRTGGDGAPAAPAALGLLGVRIRGRDPLEKLRGRDGHPDEGLLMARAGLDDLAGRLVDVLRDGWHPFDLAFEPPHPALQFLQVVRNCLIGDAGAVREALVRDGQPPVGICLGRTLAGCQVREGHAGCLLVAEVLGAKGGHRPGLEQAEFGSPALCFRCPSLCGLKPAGEVHDHALEGEQVVGEVVAFAARTVILTGRPRRLLPAPCWVIQGAARAGLGDRAPLVVDTIPLRPIEPGGGHDPDDLLVVWRPEAEV